MKPRIESRGPEIDMEKCVTQAGNSRYDMVLIASTRLRELKRQNRDSNVYITCVEALKEIESGRVDLTEYLAKIKIN